MNYTCIATAAFGLEGIVAKELKKLGLDAKGEIGGARFTATLSQMFNANLHLRCADRIYIILLERQVTTYDELFETFSSISWENFLKKDSAVHINAKCVKSQLMSPRDCQSIAKKAVINYLQNYFQTNISTESGETFTIELSIHNDMLRVALDTTGNPLNKRGYRTWNATAPIRETLASALLNVAPWKLRMPLYDPCCGSGTFLIEAAFMVLGRPSGLSRHFAMENWHLLSNEELETIRLQAKESVNHTRTFSIQGSDIDSEVLKLARMHIEQAGLKNKIQVETKHIKDVHLTLEGGCFIVNPPYGERVGERKEAQKVYAELGKLYHRHPTWGMLVITNEFHFEKFFGLRANKKRRFFNGNIECTAYIYYPLQSMVENNEK